MIVKVCVFWETNKKNPYQNDKGYVFRVPFRGLGVFIHSMPLHHLQSQLIRL